MTLVHLSSLLLRIIFFWKKVINICNILANVISRALHTLYITRALNTDDQTLMGNIFVILTTHVYFCHCRVSHNSVLMRQTNVVSSLSHKCILMHILQYIGGVVCMQVEGLQDVWFL